MTQEHPSITLLKRLDPDNLAGSDDVFADDVVFHFFNPKLPETQGDYVGLSGLGDLFGKLAKRTNGTFKANPISATPVGDELVVMQNRNTMTLEDENVDVDVVLVWRIVDGRVAEVWDIPSVYSAHTPQTQA
ncbi:nuclear transport factor 2 family protein [Pirellulales bacterium]|nr:nuclear transport factor 2 family protein [Pirellulales bacterium]